MKLFYFVRWIKFSFINTSKYHVLCTDVKIYYLLIYYFTCFSTVVPSNSCMFLSCRPFVDNKTCLVSVEVTSVSWLWHLTVGVRYLTKGLRFDKSINTLIIVTMFVETTRVSQYVMPPIFSPLLFKKTQIQLHSLKTTT